MTWTTDLRVGLLGQLDTLDPARTIRQEVIGGLADHEWAGDRRIREVLEGTLGGVELSRFPGGLDTVIGPLSGGERRRIALAKLLLDGPELLLLDEPTNHLDLEAVGWLAGHLAARRGALVVVTHDRWFLDTVCTRDLGDRRGDRARARRRVCGVGARAGRARARRCGDRGAAPQPAAQGARVAPAGPAGTHDEAAVPDRCRECADRRRARRPRPRRAPAVRDRAPRALRARRGGRQRHARRSRGPPPAHLAARTRRPRRRRGCQRHRARRRCSACSPATSSRPRESCGAARRCASGRSRRTSRSSPEASACSRRSSRCARASHSVTAAS